MESQEVCITIMTTEDALKNVISDLPVLMAIHSNLLELIDGKSIDEIKSMPEVIDMAKSLHHNASSFSSSCYLFKGLMTGEYRTGSTKEWQEYVDRLFSKGETNEQGTKEDTK